MHYLYIKNQQISLFQTIIIVLFFQVAVLLLKEQADEESKKSSDENIRNLATASGKKHKRDDENIRFIFSLMLFARSSSKVSDIFIR